MAAAAFGPQGNWHIGREASASHADEARGWDLQEAKKNKSCDTKVFSQTASEFRYTSVCNGNGDVAKVDGHVYEISPTSAEVDTKIASRSGKERNVHEELHWLASDCGKIQ